MSVSAAEVKKLRDETSAGMLDCKKALAETNGDFEKARDFLRKKGIAAAEKRSDRATGEGFVANYVHHGGKVGVLVELRCETDFVARTEEFQRLGRTIAMQVAVSNPRYLSREDVPNDVIQREKAIYHDQARESGKPENVLDKIVAGKLEKFYSEACLLEQEFLIAPESDAKSVQDFVTEIASKVGENIGVARFARLAVGEE